DASGFQRELPEAQRLAFEGKIEEAALVVVHGAARDRGIQALSARRRVSSEKARSTSCPVAGGLPAKRSRMPAARARNSGPLCSLAGSKVARPGSEQKRCSSKK